MQRIGEGLRSFKDFVVPGSHEVVPTVYLATLSSVDRENIRSLTQVLQDGMASIQQGVDVGMIAFGSSIRPARMRYHDVEDIDIRLISSANPNSKTQISTISALTERVGVFALSIKEKGGESNYSEWTEHSRVVELFSVDIETGKSTKKVGPYFLDYDNNDPSFVIVPREEGALPLHVSISGIGLENLKIHLQEERKQRQYFSLLQTFHGTKTS